MSNKLLVIFLLGLVSLTLAGDSKCSRHGYLYSNVCYCYSRWEGEFCQKESVHEVYDTSSDCDDAISRIDNLANISPEYYPGEDSEFPRLTGNSIGKAKAAYGDRGNTWTRMHDCASDFKIFGSRLSVTDIRQGSLGNCYLLAALASMITIRNGELIKDMFMTKQDNSNHVYVTRWLVDGKPRLVAVDDWIPAHGKGRPSMSKVPSDHDFWGIILEKAWAKIHGSYMITQAGWQKTVWKQITQAPVFDLYHSRMTSDDLYNKLESYFQKEYLVACYTQKNSKLVNGHAYSTLKVFNVRLDNGRNQRLVQVYNPWNRETWSQNPWGDNSGRWTSNVKRQVDYDNRNDGVFYLSIDDYRIQFYGTAYSAVERGYQTYSQDVPLTSSSGTYSGKFTYSGSSSNAIYVSIDTIDYRFFKGKKHCSNPFSVRSKKVRLPNGRTAYREQIMNAANGQYEVTATVNKNADYHNYFTFTVYAPAGTIKFASRSASDQLILKGRDCPSGCSRNGRCNRFNGMCHCYNGYSGRDCRTKNNNNNDNNNNNNNNPNCKDLHHNCQLWKNKGYCTHSYVYYMNNNCKKSCGKC